MPPGQLVVASRLQSPDSLYHLRYPAGDAPGGAALSAAALVGSAVGAALTTGSGVAGFYPAGHWVAAKMAQNLVHPRPDGETGGVLGNARASLAYYDGVNPVQFETPLGIQGGTGIFVFQKIAGPSWLNVGTIYGSSMYGWVYGTPTASISKSSPVLATFRVWNQDQLTFTDVSWNIATSALTSDFVFINSGNLSYPTGSDSGTGAFGSPFLTLGHVIGATPTTTTFPGARVYMVGGSTHYQWPTQSGSAYTGGTAIDSSKMPVVYMGLPGSGNVYIDGSLTQLYDNGANWNDLYYAGSVADRMTINGSGPAADTHTFEIYNSSRCTWDNIDFTNPISRANGSLTNSTSVFGYNDSSGGVPGKNYWFLNNCTENGRAVGAGNSMLLLAWFSVANYLVQNCSAAGVAGFGVFFKDANVNGTFRYGVVDLQPEGSTSGDAFLYGGQQGESPVVKSQNLEVCYSFIKGGAIKLDFQGGATAGAMYSYRNAVYRQDTNEPYAIGSNAPTGQGPFSSDCDVLIAKSPGGVNPSGQFTTSGTEVWVPWTGSAPPGNCPINTTTGALVNVVGGTQWRTEFEGTRGPEIA
jgi:hypothetical protein